MNADSIGKWLSVVGNFGVILGIVFLGLEIQQNTQMIRSQTRDSMTEKQVDWYYFIGNDLDKAEVQNKGSLGGLESGPEYFQFLMMVTSWFTILSNEWYQYEQGLYEADEFEPRLNRWKRQLRNPGYQSVWTINEAQFSESFRNEINRLLREIEAEN